MSEPEAPNEFEKWWKQRCAEFGKDQDDPDIVAVNAFLAWNAAIAAAEKIAWEYARGFRKASGRQTECDDVAQAIAALREGKP